MNIKFKVLVLALMLLPLTGIAQSDIFEKYSDNAAVTYVSIKPKMFQMIAEMGIDLEDAEAKSYMDMVQSITSFKTIVTDDKIICADISKWVKSRSNSLEELMEVKDDGNEVKFYFKEGKDVNHVNELLIFVNGLNKFIEDKIEINGQIPKVETVLVALKGDINLNQISKLTDKMNIPGGSQLKKRH